MGKYRLFSVISKGVNTYVHMQAAKEVFKGSILSKRYKIIEEAGEVVIVTYQITNLNTELREIIKYLYKNGAEGVSVFQH
ncbi:MAG: hypothetical protein ABIG20_04140 [archaeon]